MGGPVPAASPWRALSTPFWAIQALHAWLWSRLEAESWRTLPLSRPAPHVTPHLPFFFRPSRFCTSIYSDPLTAESCEVLSLRRFWFKGLHLGGYCWCYAQKFSSSEGVLVLEASIFLLLDPVRRRRFCALFLAFLYGSVLVHCCSVPACAMSTCVRGPFSQGFAVFRLSRAPEKKKKLQRSM